MRYTFYNVYINFVFLKIVFLYCINFFIDENPPNLRQKWSKNTPKNGPFWAPPGPPPGTPPGKNFPKFRKNFFGKKN